MIYSFQGQCPKSKVSFFLTMLDKKLNPFSCELSNIIASTSDRHLLNIAQRCGNHFAFWALFYGSATGLCKQTLRNKFKTTTVHRKFILLQKVNFVHIVCIPFLEPTKATVAK